MKNWKTTFGGLIGGVAIAILPVVQTGNWDWKAIVTGTVVAALGWVAKDFNVTGGSTPQ